MREHAYKVKHAEIEIDHDDTELILNEISGMLRYIVRKYEVYSD